MNYKENHHVLILSDLWGKRRADWLSVFIRQLEPYFTITFKDSSELAGISTLKETESALHHEFVNGGIEKAATLLAADKTEYAAVLGISVGGTIGWKALLTGLSTQRLYAVSATRLREETRIPTCPVQLYFGEQDVFKPTKEWFENMDLKPKILPSLGHELYYELQAVNRICSDLIRDFQNRTNMA